MGPTAGASGGSRSLLPSVDAADLVALARHLLQLARQFADHSGEVQRIDEFIREAEATLDQLAYEQYPKLTESEIQTLVVDNKWLATLAAAVQSELDRVSQTLTGRICELAERAANMQSN